MSYNGSQWALMLFGSILSLKYSLCSAEDRKSNRFGMTWGWCK